MRDVTPEEAATAQPPPASDVAALWLEFVHQGTPGLAWSLMTDTLRLAWAQSWVWANKDHPSVASCDRDELAAALARARGDCELLADFFDCFAGNVLEVLADIVDDYSVAANHRPIAPGLEVIILLNAGGRAVYRDAGEEPDWPRHAFLMELDASGWLVASIDKDTPAVPGWPPVL